MNIANNLNSFYQKHSTWGFYVALFFMLVSTYWMWRTHTPWYIIRMSKYLGLLSQFVLGLRILLQAPKYPIYTFGCAILLAIFYLSQKLTGEGMLFKCFLAVAASRGTDFRITVRIFLISFIIVAIAVPFAYYLGWATDIVKHRYGLVGHSWGFSNPNRAASFLLILVVLTMVYFNIQNTIKVWLFCWIGSLIIGWITLSSTSVLLLSLQPLIYWSLLHFRPAAYWWALLPIAGLAVSTTLAIYYGPSTGTTTFESRFSIPYLVYENHGLSWFGQDCHLIKWKEAFDTGKEPIYLNNAFLSVFLRDGIVPGIVIIVFFSHFLYRMARYASALLLSIVFCIFLLGFSQEHMLNIMFNFTLLGYFSTSPYNQMFSCSHTKENKEA